MDDWGRVNIFTTFETNLKGRPSISFKASMHPPSLAGGLFNLPFMAVFLYTYHNCRDLKGVKNAHVYLPVCGCLEHHHSVRE